MGKISKKDRIKQIRQYVNNNQVVSVIFGNACEECGCIERYIIRHNASLYGVYCCECGFHFEYLNREQKEYYSIKEND